MANDLDLTKVDNYLKNAFSYGTNGAIFSASSHFLQLGKLVSKSAKTCETWSEWFFGELETLAGDFVGVLNAACKYKKLIEEGSEAVALAEAVPIEEGVCDLTSFAEEAYEVIKLVNDGDHCHEMHYNLKQYVSYGNNNSPDSSSTYDADVGTFAGNQYSYTKNCKPLADKLEKTAFNKLTSSLVASDAIKQVSRPVQERKLQDSEPYFKNPNCAYCLPEAEFIDFFQGFYDG